MAQLMVLCCSSVVTLYWYHLTPDIVTELCRGVSQCIMSSGQRKEWEEGGGCTDRRVTEGIIFAGWGDCHHLLKQTPTQRDPCMTPQQIDSFNMSYTKQLLSGTGPKRKPVLVSRTRSDPWLPAGHSKRNIVKNKNKDPFCSVCLNDNLTEADVELKREMEREVKLIQSKPSVAYKKHSPRNWSQDNLLGKCVNEFLLDIIL